MAITGILPDIGLPVSVPGFDESILDDLTPGQLTWLATVILKRLGPKFADPAVAHEFATFNISPGADWSGYKPGDEPHVALSESEASDIPEKPHAAAHENNAQWKPPARPLPTPPDRYFDSLPALASMIAQQQRALDSILTNFARHVDAALLQSQPTYFGAPIGVKAYRDAPTYFREVLKFSRTATKKIHDRLPYVTFTPGQDSALAWTHPKLAHVAQAFSDGRISGENLDRIISLDQELTKYAHKVGKDTRYKDEVLAAFEPSLVDAAETSTPDELSKAKQRWASTIAHAIDPDGPPVAEAVRKRADNAINTKTMPDGSGRIWMHATNEVYIMFQDFGLKQLNGSGTTVELPQDLIDLLRVQQDTLEDENEDSESSAASDDLPRFDNLNDLKFTHDPDEPVAIDADGNTVSAEELNPLDEFTPGQQLGAIMIGLFMNLLTMDQTELQIKKSHGAPSKLHIVQDIETAYKTLGLGQLPEEVRRPPGKAGVLPPVISRPNPDTAPPCFDPTHTLGYQPPSWTAYMSEAINIGPIHSSTAKVLACDTEIHSNIWSQHHMILQQGRAFRLFTTAQRQAVLARDRGCQAPGCTVPAVYCQIHHILSWYLGGKTNIDNAVALCSRHHDDVHNGKWVIRKHHGMIFFQPAPWLDPYQPLLRNLYWAL